LGKASDLAIRAFLHVVNEPLFTVLETSGVGFKLWMIANEFRAVSWWATFLEGIVSAIGSRPQSGVVELFPSRDPQKYGRGLRAFGTWNPRNDAINGILFDDLDQLLPSLEAATDRERSYLSSRETEKERFAITQPATRHTQLLAMVGFLIVRCSHDMALEFANWQFSNQPPLAGRATSDNWAMAGKLRFRFCEDGIIQRVPSCRKTFKSGLIMIRIKQLPPRPPPFNKQRRLTRRINRQNAARERKPIQLQPIRLREAFSLVLPICWFFCEARRMHRALAN
jgi:hypothetical protein